MAISDVEVQAKPSALPRSQRETVAEALQILTAPHQEALSKAEIIERVSAVRKLVQGYEIPRQERPELDLALMQMAFHEPNASKEARAIVRAIFRDLIPKGGPNYPRRNLPGSEHRPQPDLPLPTAEDVANWDAEYALRHSEP